MREHLISQKLDINGLYKEINKLMEKENDDKGLNISFLKVGRFRTQHKQMNLLVLNKTQYKN